MMRLEAMKITLDCQSEPVTDLKQFSRSHVGHELTVSLSLSSRRLQVRDSQLPQCYGFS